MPASSDFLPFAIGGSANVESQASWAGDSVVTNGFTAGIAQSSQVNKALRQTSFISAGLASLVATQLSIHVADDADLPGFVTDLTSALAAIATNSVSLTGYLLSSTAASTYASITAVQGGTLLYAAASGTNTITAALSPVPASLTTGMVVVLKAGGTNTGAATLNLNSLGAKSITYAGSALRAGALISGQIYSFVYDGTNWQLQTPTMAGIVASSLGVNGYEIYSHGKIEQWGTLAIGSGANVISTSLTFPIAFGAVWNITGNADTYCNPGWQAITVTFTSRSNGGCIVVADSANSSQSFSAGCNINWRAIGSV